MPETIESSMEGVWDLFLNAGGRRKADNPNWCKNP